jgi:hypothetical protein
MRKISITELINSQELYKKIFIFVTLWIVASASFQGHYAFSIHVA